jgi:uncharacterized tellurite resistance protein B-like protein
MLSRLFPRRQPSAPVLPQPNAQLALGALLVRTALADHSYKLAEVSLIDRILAMTFNLKPLEAAKLRANCEALERHAPGTGEFARILREEVAYADRLKLAEALWAVALADGEEDPEESALVIATEQALGLEDADMVAVRERALGTN